MRIILFFNCVFLFSYGYVYSQKKIELSPCPGVLINNVCWAESNVDSPGTFSATPESYGMLYQWNRKKGWSATDAVSGWDISLPSGKYWESANDPCPAGWRIPTDMEFSALLDNMNVTSMETSQNGVRGREFTDNTTGNSIFLPKVNYRSDSGTINNMGYYGWYWSNSPLSDSFAKALYIHEKTCNSVMMAKNYGLTIRCVAGDPPDCDHIVTDTSVVICAKDLPYIWDGRTFDVGTESGVYRFQYTSAVTGCDSIVNLHLTVQQPYETLLYDTVCRGDGYHGYGFHLPEGTTGGTFTETYPTVHGCDSTITLHLYVSLPYLFLESQSICQGDTVDFRGKRLYTSGVYDDSLRTVHGCDSIFRLTLTVHPAPDLSFSDAVCYGNDYHNHGFNLTAVTTDTIVSDTLQTPWGCDSIRTLFLSVNPLYDIQLYDTICEGSPYTGYGFNVTEAGTHVLRLQSIHGCDSIVTLHLTVLPVYHPIVRDSVCPSERYDRYGFHLSDIRQSGTYRLPLQTVHGCDSTVTLELYVYQPYLFPESQSICEGDTVDFRGRRLYESGIYYDSLRTIHQCDSIYSLDLSVHPVYDVRLSGVLCEGNPYTGYGFNVTEAGTHVRHLQSIHGCDSVVTLTLTEEKKVQGSIGFLLDDCSTHGYSFFLDSQIMMIDTWQWDMGDGTVYRSEEGFHQYADSGVYRIRLLAETHSGCENRFSHVQHVPFYLPEVSIHADRWVIDEDYPTVRFHTDVPQDMACEWDFGDGTTARGDSVSHTFDAVTRKYYDVTLRVMNADSCVTENGMRIEVVFLPKSLNTFTPNGDGVNDIFMAGFRIEVTDRNGLRIYTGEDGWDGTVNGRQARQDTYFFRLFYRTANGERIKTGYVTLIR